MEDRICIECGCVIENDGTLTSNGWVCSDCRDAEYQECYHCGDWVRTDELTSVYTSAYGDHAEMVCQDCLENRYSFCEDCNEYYPSDTMTMTGRGDVICRNCRDDHYSRCAGCGDWFNVDDMMYNDYRDSYYCSDCYDSDDYTDDRIREYHDNPKTRFFGDMTNGRQHYIGIELEIDRRDRASSDERNLLDCIENVAGSRLYFMHDGSLDYGFEIISQPHTYDEIINNLHMDEVMENCKYYGYSSHDIGTCGLHFHLSRELFGPARYRNTAIEKMMLFYDNYFEEIVKVARRGDSQLHWCNRYSGENNHKLSVKERAAKYKEFDEHSYRHDDRYKVVNTTNNDTIEIRIMRGTLNYSTFLASLDFVYTVANNSRTISWKQSTDASYWLRGLKPETVEYLRSRSAFLDYIQ